MFIFVSCIYLLFTGAGYLLVWINLNYLRVHGDTVPQEFQGTIDPELIKKISRYTIENSRVGIVESIVGNLFVVLFLFGGLVGIYDRWITSLTGSFLWGGALFFLLLFFAQTLVDIPFSLYRNFRIENRYGFNTMTVRLWISDLFKSAAIASLLGSVVIVSALALVQASPAWWWLWVWAFLLVFGIFVMYVSPYLIEPLFFKFEPLKVAQLENKIRVLMERTGLKISRVFQVDASRRSRHSNAYFTGIGRVKRIVLFDTLLDRMSEKEVLAVLAHEVGHWKKRHVLKRLLLTETLAFCGLFLAWRLIAWNGLPGLVGVDNASFYARVVIAGFLGSLVLFPITPLFSFLSRKDEREADYFAIDLLGESEGLASALVKLSRDNLSNLHPHPVFAGFYYSHPLVAERIRTLNERGKKASR